MPVGRDWLGVQTSKPIAGDFTHCRPLEELEGAMQWSDSGPRRWHLLLVRQPEHTLFGSSRSLLHRHRVEGLEKLSRGGVPDLHLAAFAAQNQTRPVLVQRH